MFVTGATGLLGSKFMGLNSGFEIFGSYRSQVIDDYNSKLFQLDVTDSEKSQKLIKKQSPDIIIHTAALTDVDYCENHKKEAKEVNVHGTENIAKIAREIEAKMVYVSTDYVFDGKSGPYSEDDKPNPISYYGRTKLEGENVIKKLGIDYLIVRTTVLFGCHPLGILNFATWVIGKLTKKQKINVVNDQFGNPTLADNCAEVILSILKNGKSGIYNVVGKDYVNRFDFACKIADFFNLDKSLIEPVTTAELNQPAKRPKFGGLKTDKIEKELNVKLLTIEDSLRIMKGQMRI